MQTGELALGQKSLEAKNVLYVAMKYENELHVDVNVAGLQHSRAQL